MRESNNKWRKIRKKGKIK